MSLFYVAYAFSGWNAAAYAADEFHEPKRDVPRAMLIGCALVGVLYLLVNWVLVANLSPEQARVVYQYEEARVTLGHIVAAELLGELGSRAMSAVIAVAMLSSMSAMLLVGPRVYAEMARDGFLPSALAAPEGKPPSLSVLLQGVLAVALLHLHSIGELLRNVAGVLVLFSALVALGLFFVKRRHPNLAAPRPQALIAAAIYVGSSAWMLFNALRSNIGLLPWLAAVASAGLGAYFLTGTRSP
jgi:APA family basic amino acid/polyamine antiporter